jgi:hypothetical protein
MATTSWLSTQAEQHERREREEQNHQAELLCARRHESTAATKTRKHENIEGLVMS